MWLYSSGHTETRIDQRLRPANHEIERMGKCNGSPNPHVFPIFRQLFSRTIVRRKQCSTQPCFYRFVYSFQQVLL